MALINRPKLHEALTGALLPLVFTVPFYLGAVIWGIADHPAARVSAFFFGANCFVGLKSFYYYFVLLGIQKDSVESTTE